MNAQRLTMTLAGLFILVALGLGHMMGQFDLSSLSWLWFIIFIGVNLFQSGITGFCPLTRILLFLGIKPAS
ncbi:MAG: DUF2892 domain-containing protein [Rhodobacteraceae bacterium]|nr:DUF2892 domain-containing protein [Paracoccaceae bacterium]